MINAPCMGLVLAGAPDKSAADPTDASQFRRVETLFIFDLPISLPFLPKNMEPIPLICVSSSGGRMEPVMGINCSPAIGCISSSAPIWQDVLAQAVTGELLAAMNYTSLSEICEDTAEVADALEHARNERGHAA